MALTFAKFNISIKEREKGRKEGRQAGRQGGREGGRGVSKQAIKNCGWNYSKLQSLYFSAVLLISNVVLNPPS